MALTPGTRLGPYEIVAALASGGMGEIYRARDTRLDRTVAIKVLPEKLAADPEFRQRLEREARAISQLAHPNICTLHDVGEHDGTLFLVMEFLDGETLADRLARATAERPALAVGDALAIATQIADALAAAHRQGIVHRDLKPGNVMLTKSAVKLLDFGLAKTVAPIAVTSASMVATTPPQAVTAQGTILGTFNYMAPEQVEGGEADARTDIFAFGCVLYEMLAGQKAFQGKTPASLIAAILERDPPPLPVRQPLASRLLDSIVRRCLAKAPDDRWQNAADLASALRWAGDASATGAAMTSVAPAPDGGAVSATVPAVSAETGRRAAAFLKLAALAIAVVVAAVGLGWRYLPASGAAIDREPVRFEVLPPSDSMWSPAPVGSMAQLALSPDGRKLAFVAVRRRAVSQVWIRDVATVQAQPLAGTEGASFPFWSPDGRFVAFFAGGKLKKIDISGGTPQPLADAGNGRGGSWSAQGDIIFTSAPNGPISRVSSSGGVVTHATTLDPAMSAITHYWPQFLPDGRRFLFYQRSAKQEHQGIYAASLDAPGITRVLDSDGLAIYTPGYLLLIRNGMLFAQPFNEQTLSATGEALRVADNVGYFGGTLGYASATASMTGSIAHGPSVVLATVLQWRDRNGVASPGPLPTGSYRSPQMSPDQKHVALARVEVSSAPDIWLVELARGTLVRVTSHPQNDWFPVWSAAGDRVYFASTRLGSSSFFERPVNGSTPEQPLIEAQTTGLYSTDISKDGRVIIYHQVAPAGYDLGLFEPASRTRTSWLSSASNEVQGAFSPDGRWVAYASDESGRFEVYVRPFPAADALSTISLAGGMQPRWRGDGRELFYAAPDGTIMAVDVNGTGTAFEAGTPRALFKAEFPEANAPYPTDYAVTADGQRFLVNTVVDQPTIPTLTVILNWANALNR